MKCVSFVAQPTANAVDLLDADFAVAAAAVVVVESGPEPECVDDDSVAVAAAVVLCGHPWSKWIWVQMAYPKPLVLWLLSGCLYCCCHCYWQDVDCCGCQNVASV